MSNAAPATDAAAQAAAAAAAPVQQPAAPVPTPPAAAPSAAAPAAPQTNTQTDASATPWDDPATARAEIERLRRERGDERIAAKATARDEGMQTAIKALAAAVGIELPSEGPATLEEALPLIGTVTTERDAAREAQTAAERRLLAVTEAWAAGINPTKLTYLEYLLGNDDTFKTLDPKDAEAGAKVKASIAAQVAADPTLKTTGSTAASGAQSYGGAGEPTEITQAQFDAWPLDKRQELYFADRATYNRLTGRE